MAGYKGVRRALRRLVELLHLSPDPHAQAWLIEAAGVPVGQTQMRWVCGEAAAGRGADGA